MHVVVVVTTLGVAFTSPASAEFRTAVAVTNATVVTGTGVTIEAGTIVMEGGRIIAVGRDVDVPSDAERVDATGLIVYPGFIDAYTHIGIPAATRTSEERSRIEDVNPDPREGPLAATRAANRRGVSPEVDALELYVPDEAQLEPHRAAGFTAALIAPREKLLGGRSCLLSLSGEPKRRSVIATPVAMHGSFDPGEEGEYPTTLMGAIAQIRQVMSDARWYAKAHKYAARHPMSARRVPTDATLEALQPLIARSQRVIFEANTENEIRRALDLASELDLEAVISGAREAWKLVDRIKAEHVALVVTLKLDEEPEFGRESEADRKRCTESEAPDVATRRAKYYEPLKLRAERRRLWDEQLDNVVRLHEADVGFSLSTNGFEKPSEFFCNLRRVIRRGLPVHAAVGALTAAPAELFGQAAQLGVIAPGRTANLTLLDKPLSDDEAKARLVFIDGRKFRIDVKSKTKDEDEKEKEEKAATKDAGEVTLPKGVPTEPAWAVETL
ncbi:MAG: amidohydrolase family protein, partial [Phycisphaerae bacterium]